MPPFIELGVDSPSSILNKMNSDYEKKKSSKSSESLEYRTVNVKIIKGEEPKEPQIANVKIIKRES